jgi:glycosyltransferase involved in cell wall biosynthesis
MDSHGDTTGRTDPAALGPAERRRKILFVTPYAPQPLRPRSWTWICYLVRRGHAVTLAVAAERNASANHLDELRDLGVEILHAPLRAHRKALNYLAAVAHAAPLQAWHAWIPGLGRALQEELATTRYDILHIEHLRAARYALPVQTIARRQGTRIVWDAVDCISALLDGMARQSSSWRWRFAARLERSRTRAYERALLNRFDRILVASPLDRRALLDLDSRSEAEEQIARHIEILPNGVWSTSEDHSTAAGHREPIVVFSGVLRYHANRAAAEWLLREIMPLVWNLMPSARLQLVGAHPGRRLRRLAETAAGPIEITGHVPRIEPYLATAAVAVAPLRYGGGTQFKVLEAWAAGTPVVADGRTARALGAADGRDLLKAETADEFATAITRLLAEPDLRTRLGQAGRRLARERFSWDLACQRLEHIYDTILR